MSLDFRRLRRALQSLVENPETSANKTEVPAPRTHQDGSRRAAIARRVPVATCAASLVGLFLLVSPLHLLGAVILAVGVFAIGVSRPTWGLWLVILLFAIHPLITKVAQVNFGVTGSALIVFSAWKEVALFAVLLGEFGSLAADYRAGRLRLPRPALMDAVAGAFVILIAVGFAVRHDALALNQVRLLLFPVGVYTAIRIRPIDTGTYFKAAVILAVPIAVFAIVQSSAFGWSFVHTYWGQADLPIPFTFTAQSLVGPRAAGTYGSPNELGFALAAWGFMAAALMVMRPKQNRWMILAVLVILVALALTFSRSAIVAFGAGLILVLAVIAAVSPSPRRAFSYLSLAIMPAIILSGAVYFARGGTDLIASTLHSLTSSSASTDTGGPSLVTTTASPSPSPAAVVDASTEEHLDSLAAGWSEVASHPLGIGLGTVGSRGVPGISDKPQYILESYYLSIGVMLGWLGLVWAVLLPLVMLLSAIHALVRGNKTVGVALLGMSVSVAIVSFWLPTIMEPEMAILPWSLAALAVSTLPGKVPSREAAANTGARGDPNRIPQTPA